MSQDNSGIILTVRLIRSFEHRNWKPLVLKNVDLQSTTEQLISVVQTHLKNSTLPPPFKNFNYDTLKIEYQPFQFKTNDPLINQSNDATLILISGRSLQSQNIQNETEISFFKLQDYIAYKEQNANSPT